MNSHNQPLISVYLPTRNRAGLVREAVATVQKQSYEQWELIVVNDASDDDTQAVVDRLAQRDSRIRVLHQPKPHGAPAARNRAIAEAQGMWITGIDDDDRWHPDRLMHLYDSFAEGFSAVCSYDVMVDGNRRRVWKKPPVIDLDDLLYYNRVGNQVLTKTENLRAIGGFDEALPAAQDYDCWIRLVEAHGPIKTVPESLQEVAIGATDDRITNSERRLAGYRRCFEKHHDKMSVAHRRYQQYRLKLASGERLSLLHAFRASPPKLWFKELKRMLQT